MVFAHYTNYYIPQLTPNNEVLYESKDNPLPEKEHEGFFIPTLDFYSCC